MKKTGRTVPIYPRVTKENSRFLNVSTKKFTVSEAEFIDKALTHFRKHYTASEMRTMLGLAQLKAE